MCHLFFRKGKSECWKIVLKDDRFVNTFSLHGQVWELDEQIFVNLEEYVCQLYGYRQKNVNNVRTKLFDKKYVRQGKAKDIFTLAPMSIITEATHIAIKHHCKDFGSHRVKGP